MIGKATWPAAVLYFTLANTVVFSSGAEEELIIAVVTNSSNHKILDKLYTLSFIPFNSHYQ